MKKFLYIVLAIAAVAFVANLAAKMGRDIEVGGTYRGEGRTVTVEYVGRGDSVLVRYPYQFELAEGALASTYVIYSGEGRRSYMMELIFKQKFERVHSTPPEPRQP